MYPATGTISTNTSVSCQLMKQAAVRQVMHLSGSPTILPKRTLSPTPICSVSLVKRAIRSDVPVPAIWRHILMEGPAKEGISQVEEHTEGDVANKRFVDEFERTANEDADHDRSHDPEDRLEAIFGHVADDAGLEELIPIDPRSIVVVSPSSFASLWVALRSRFSPLGVPGWASR